MLGVQQARTLELDACRSGSLYDKLVSSVVGLSALEKMEVGKWRRRGKVSSTGQSCMKLSII